MFKKQALPTSMVNRCKVRTKYLLWACIGFLFLFAFLSPAKSFPHSPYYFINNKADSIPASWASKLIYKNASNALTLSNKPPLDLSIYSKDSLAFIVDYKAKDSTVLMVPQNQFYLHNEAEIKNPDADISANTIEFNKNTNIVKFYGNKDTSNAISGRPTILQNGSKSILDSGYYNIKSQKGILKNTYYNEGEIYVQAAIAKKIDSNSIFVKDARFTTCNLDPPHFDLHAFKMKMISGKLAVSGPAIPEFEGVPMPIVIPFGIYPLTRGRHSGLLPAVFQQDNIKGLGLTGLGYYKVINDNWDVTTRVDLYSYGGYTINVNPDYYKRYAYRGNLNVSYQFTKTLNSYGNVAQEYTKNKTIHIGWSHSMDPKSHPGESFSASVNAGSTLYNSLQTLNPYQSFNNQLNSSITFSKNWDNGKYNLSMQANHSQNSVNHSINIQFPTINFSTATINPFQKKELVGKPKWYENIGISYNGTFQNQLSFYDTAKNSIKSLLDTMQWGAQHQIPITLTLPAVGPLLFSPSVSYSENWISRKLISHWDSTLAKVDTTIEKGFFTARQMSFGIAMNTRIFGTMNFKHGNIRAIHHEIRPTISLNYTPNMASSYFKTLQVDTTGRKQRVSEYSYPGSVGGFSETTFGGINFGIDNILQMKVLNKKDTTGDPDKETKKVSLIDGLSINSGYNLVADSLNWSPVSFSLRSSLFNNKLNFNANMTLDQYETDAYGTRINKLLWAQGKLGRITNGTISMSTSFSSKKTDQKTDQQRVASDPDPNMPPDQQLQQLNYVRDHASDFVDFNIPWNIQASYAMGFSKVINPDYSGFHNVYNSSLNLNGDFSLSPKWKAGGSIYFDVIHHQVGMMTLFLTRDMHCWQMAINVSPIGRFKSFSIVLNPKSGILRDLRINRSRSFY